MTMDQNKRHPQDLSGSRLSIVLVATAWQRIQHQIEEIRAATERIQAGPVSEVPIARQAPTE